MVTSAPSAWTANMQARPHRVAVEQHRARAAHAVLAPEMRAGERGSPRAGSRRASCALRPSARRALAVHRDARPLHRCRLRRARSTAARRPDAARCAAASRRDACTSLGRIEHRAPPHPATSSARSHPSDNSRFGRRRARTGVDPTPNSARPGPDVRTDRARDAGQREVAVAAGDFLDREPATASPHREAHRDEQLVGCRARSSTCRRRSRRPRPCAARRLDPTSSNSAPSAIATAGYSDAGIGVGQRAADRAAVADLEVADQRRRPRDQRHGRGRRTASRSIVALARARARRQRSRSRAECPRARAMRLRSTR